MVEAVFSKEDTTPEAIAQLAFEHLLAYSAGRKESFSVSFKANGDLDPKAWDTFIEILFSPDLNLDIKEQPIQQSDQSMVVHELTIGGVPIYETYILGELGQVDSITYASLRIDLDAQQTPNPSVGA